MRKSLKISISLIILSMIIFTFINGKYEILARQEVKKAIVGYKKLQCNVDSSDEYLRILYENNEKDIEEFVEQEKQYLNNYEPYLTEKWLVTIRNRRDTGIYRHVVFSEEGRELKLIDVKFKKISYNDAERKFVVDYTASLHLMNESTDELKQFEELNQATLIEENGHWKIKRSTIHFAKDMMNSIKY